MKIIHCADLHLGSKLNSLLPKAKADERRTEILHAFADMVGFARRENIGLILMSGDVFDSNKPFKRDKEYFYDVISENKDIAFVYLRGNHDNEESYTETGLDNLYLFGNAWTTHTFDDVTVSGIEMMPGNADSLYDTLILDRQKKNIVMLHGELSGDSGYNKICLNKLANKSIDYLALGHIHSFSTGRLDGRGKYAYSGCLEGRGFDETESKGFVVLDTDADWSIRFVPFSKRRLHDVDVDISECNSQREAESLVLDTLDYEDEDIVRVNLVGDIKFDGTGIEKLIQSSLSIRYYHVVVRDRTRMAGNYEDYRDEMSLRGEFIRAVLSSEYDEDRKKEIIRVGLNALEGREDRL